jgi:predicted O-methyltransferase YrrM
MNISGFFIYRNLMTMQHPSIEENFTKLLTELKPVKVLEIGTSSGGLTLLLRDILDNNGLESTRLVSYDVNDPIYLRNYVNEGVNIELKVENIFNQQYDKLENGQNVIDIITSEGTTLVLCDGGNKKNEFRILSDYLKVGDVIMAHDYSPNESYFQEHINNKIWNWLEIQDSDINESCINNNLKPYMEDDFRKVVWVCKIKE